MSIGIIYILDQLYKNKQLIVQDIKNAKNKNLRSKYNIPHCTRYTPEDHKCSKSSKHHQADPLDQTCKNNNNDGVR